MKAVKYVLPISLLPISLMLTAASAFAEDLDGEKLYAGRGCVSCHGVGGNEPIMDSYPKLGGQSAGYLAAKLKSYKKGEISGGQSAIMAPMASLLSDDETKAIADYLSGSATCKPTEE